MSVDPYLDRHAYDLVWPHAFARGADNHQIHYVRMGQGDAVLLLHGWPGFWYDWRRLAPRLATQAMVIAPDLRGFGASDKPDLPPNVAYTPKAHAVDMLTLLDNLAVDRFVVVGYDLGALVAQELARQAPTRVRGLVLANPQYPGIGARRFSLAAQREIWYQYFHNTPRADRIISSSRQTVSEYLAYFYDYWLGRKASLRPAEFEAIVDTYAEPNAFRASIAWFRAVGAGAPSVAATAPLENPADLKVAQPTVVLWGEADPIMPAGWSDRLTEHFTNSTVTRLPGVGHFTPIEAPEELADAVRSILGRE